MMPVGADTTAFGTETPYRKTPPTNMGTVQEAGNTTTPPTTSTAQQTDADDALVPVNTVAPAVTGTTTNGQTLTCAPGTFVPAASSNTFQWYRVHATTGAWTAIAGATANTRVLAAGDVGFKIVCRVWGKDASGRAGAPADSNVTAVVA
jgi:hypothetical protein